MSGGSMGMCVILPQQPSCQQRWRLRCCIDRQGPGSLRDKCALPRGATEDQEKKHLHVVKQGRGFCPAGEKQERPAGLLGCGKEAGPDQPDCDHSPQEGLGALSLSLRSCGISNSPYFEIFLCPS